MIIAGVYSFNDGEKEVERLYPKLLREVKAVIKAVNATTHKSKISQEKPMAGKALYNPGEINNAFKEKFEEKGWKAKARITVKYSSEFYLQSYKKKVPFKQSYREIDFIKEKLGVEVQFGKYSFAPYDVCLKMPIFKKQGVIDCGIEVLPMKALANDMSSGVPYFEKLVWELEQRSASNIDIPVMIIGIDAQNF